MTFVEPVHVDPGLTDTLATGIQTLVKLSSRKHTRRRRDGSDTMAGDSKAHAGDWLLDL